MEKEVGTFTVEDAFRVPERGWLLVGVVQGTVLSGHHLAFTDGSSWRISGLTWPSRDGKISLLIPAQFTSRQNLIDQQIIGATARVLE